MKYLCDKYADLHLHTNSSDGILSPEQIVIEASKQGLSAIAITDHDTVDGVKPAILAGKRCNVEVIPGVELSAEYGNEEIHILGFYMEWNDPQFQKKLLELRDSRRIRAMKMIDKLNQLGISLEYDDVFVRADLRSIGRPHVAAALVENGFVDTVSEAFYKFLRNDGPAYVSKQKLSPAEAIAMILDVDGIPVLAHPGMLQSDYLAELVSSGLMGLEAFHIDQPIQIRDYYCDLANQYDLLITGGSDFHGNCKRIIGGVRLPYKYVDDLKKAKACQKNFI